MCHVKHAENVIPQSAKPKLKQGQTVIDVFSWDESVCAQICKVNVCPALWQSSCKKKAEAQKLLQVLEVLRGSAAFEIVF